MKCPGRRVTFQSDLCVLLTGTVLVLVCQLLAAQHITSEPILKSATKPYYPPLARLARIEGQVRLEFGLSREGNPSSITVVSGHPLLVPAAL